ncbi:MAG: ATP-binding cassette domain-containing protein [Spirochaetota bacterium]
MSRLLEVRNLNKIHRRNTLFEATARSVHAVCDVSFDVQRGEILGIVGESGCGKSTLARAVLHLDPPTDGRVLFDGEDVAMFRGRRLLHFRKRAQIVFQDPYSALNPRLTVGRAVEEGMIAQRVPADERARRSAELFDLVGLQTNRMNDYPHEFSGGQKQRIVIARALAVHPEMLVLDEPVSSLDVSIQAQILNLLLDIKESLDLTYLFISHDLNLVAYLSDRIGVMRRGELLELAPTETLLSSPQDEYTRTLFGSSPRYEDRRLLATPLLGRNE